MPEPTKAVLVVAKHNTTCPTQRSPELRDDCFYESKREEVLDRDTLEVWHSFRCRYTSCRARVLVHPSSMSKLVGMSLVTSKDLNHTSPSPEGEVI
jgi:hypothetical protein